MNIEVLKYNLPDIDLLNPAGELHPFIVWRPERIYIILGVSNNCNDSLIKENVIIDNIPVYKRPSGGETVMLTPQNLVISAIDNNLNYKNPKDCFVFFNNKIITALCAFGVKNLSMEGISDISINARKILGSSIYRSRDKILYQSVLNVNENPVLLERYLNHPKREPGYRQNRKHSDFVTSLYKEGYVISFDEIIKKVSEVFSLPSSGDFF